MCFTFGIIQQVLIWDVEAQPNRQANLGATASHPDLVHLFDKTRI